MRIIEGILDYTKKWTFPDVYLFTGNPVKKNNGAIVMGRGAAKMVRDFYPGIDQEFGRLIKDGSDRLRFHVISEGQELGWFCVKDHWAANANAVIVYESAVALRDIARKFPHITFHMNFPAIGNGHLDFIQVREICKVLPDNVLLYKA